MTRLLILTATVFALVAWQPGPAWADYKTDLAKLLPNTPEGWKAISEPTWRASGAGGRAFNAWRKLKGAGSVEVIYQWKPISLDRTKSMMSSRSRAKQMRWQHVELNGKKWMLRQGKKSTFLQTVIGDNLVVFAQSFDAERSDVETFAKAVPYDKLKGVQ